MTDKPDDKPDDEPDDEPDDDDDGWKSKGEPRMRQLIREELAAHHERTKPKDPDPPKQDPPPEKPPENPPEKKEPVSAGQPRKRSRARGWFGLD